MFTKPIEQIYVELESSKEGISSLEAQIRLEKNGFNELNDKKPDS
jgi:hypothetical protein